MFEMSEFLKALCYWFSGAATSFFVGWYLGRRKLNKEYSLYLDKCEDIAADCSNILDEIEKDLRESP